MEKVKVELDPADAEAFKLFLRYQREFLTLLNHGFFVETKTLFHINIDPQGRITSILAEKRLL